MWARLYTPDAVVLEQQVEHMSRGVCEADPRTLGDRRSDALAALRTGATELACACGNDDCPAAARQPSPPATAVIHVVAHPQTVAAARTDHTTTAPDGAAAPAASGEAKCAAAAEAERG
jgi:hypothetical protein